MRKDARVRVLLRCRRTKLFVIGEDGWAAQRELARNFVSGYAAIQWAVANGVEAPEVVLDFGDPQMDMVLPLMIPPRTRDCEGRHPLE